MNDPANDRVGPLANPWHPGELIRESMDEVGWNVTETAAWLGCERVTQSRLMNSKAGVSANTALAREETGGHCRPPDEDASELPATAGAPGANCCRTVRTRMARVIDPRACCAGRLSFRETCRPFEARPNQD